jgi:CRISPR/Cas system-associated exonuclease Cas4 (RecB family)
MRTVGRIAAARDEQTGGRHSMPPVSEETIDVKGLRLTGKPDRVERSVAGVRIIDLKTGRQTQAEVLPQQRRQLLIYAYLWARAHGEWPTTAGVERSGGNRLLFSIDPSEAERAAIDAERLLDGFNEKVDKGVTEAALASPSSESCGKCSFRAVCAPFFRSLSQSWGWHLIQVLGRVSAVEEFPPHWVVTIDCELPSEWSQRLLRVRGWPEAHLPKVGARLGIVDAVPSARTGEATLTWETQVGTWADG